MHRDLRYCTTLKTALFQAIEVHDRCPILCLATPRATTEWRMSSCYPCLSIVSSASTAYSIAPDSVGQHRSEEHTSELQSLMRISYAVICFKKNKTIKRTYPTP